jgi:hypothetical protein
VRFIFAGHTGIRKAEALESLRVETARRFNVPQNKIGIYCVEDDIKRILSTPSLVPYLESTNENRKRELWINAFTEILKREKEEGPLHSFLSIHLTFQRKSCFFSPIAWNKPISLIKEWGASKIITLIDDIYLVKKRIQPGTRFRLRELTAWRNIEILVSDILAREIFLVSSNSYPFYSRSPVVAVKHPPKMLDRLLFEDQMKKVYACIPISKTRENKENILEINNYLRELHEKFIVFDPLTIDERPLIHLVESLKLGKSKIDRMLFNKEDRWRIEKEFSLCSDENEYPIELELQEVLEIAERFKVGDKSEIDRNIELRDLRLIDQCDFVIVYRPFYGKKDITPGMRSEILHAKDVRCCPIYFIHDPDIDGEFQNAFEIEMPEMFKNLSELIFYLKEERR